MKLYFYRCSNIPLYCIAAKIAPVKLGGHSIVSYLFTCKSYLQARPLVKFGICSVVVVEILQSVYTIFCSFQCMWKRSSLKLTTLSVLKVK